MKWQGKAMRLWHLDGCQQEGSKPSSAGKICLGSGRTHSWARPSVESTVTMRSKLGTLLHLSLCYGAPPREAVMGWPSTRAKGIQHQQALKQIPSNAVLWVVYNLPMHDQTAPSQFTHSLALQRSPV